MPVQPGEVSLLTVFADVHYFFSPPTTKPPHHRFDKRSYVYLYHDALNKRGRLEIANHAGTAEQDAFTGYLDLSTVDYTYKQPTLFTITVAPPSPSPPPQTSTWQLPAPDPRAPDNKYMYKIHTVDIYLWTPEDASLFLDSLKRVLHQPQVRVSDIPPAHAEHRDSMSPVVQKLEKAVISTPYDRSASISTTHSGPPPQAQQPQPQAPQAQTPVSPPPPPAPQPPQAFTPMAYNPAAPAAPEPIAHREKTPPPPDADSGLGLNAHPQAQPPPQSAYTNPLTQTFTPQPATGYAPGPGLQRANTFAPVPAPTSSPYQQAAAASPVGYPPSFAGPPADPNAHLYAGSTSHTPQPAPGGLQRQNTMPAYGFAGPPIGPPSAVSPTAGGQAGYPGYPAAAPQGAYGASPVAGPAAGAYGGSPAGSPGLPGQGYQQGYAAGQQVPGQQVPGQYGSYGPVAEAGTTHSLHGQLYRPEGEGAKPAKPGGGQEAATGKFEQRADRIEKGVSRFLKKLDKKF
ncbi:hypothetical protein EJ06DRAFT_541707 [Trichodelitschia bisporula]|uniref:Uncharacterized protein n=1 Tax=Trichodelitschia bisporula TaxID=703511 RepID=A0A6G1I3V4_9PEZI|nr:hypothetical protein EJ06DRAFT_541707 [Trichodelitschia bisporula]